MWSRATFKQHFRPAALLRLAPAILCIACGTPHDSGARGAVPLFDSILVRDSNDAFDPLLPVVVGAHGEVLYHARRGSNPTMQLLTLDGTLHRFAPLGEGPGEAKMGFPVAINDSTVLGWDFATLRLSEWRHSGPLARSVDVRRVIGPRALIDGHGIIGLGTVDGVDLPVLLSPATGRVVSLISANDSFYRSMFPRDADPLLRLTNPPVIGAWSGGVIVANGLTYQLGLYSWSGKLQHVLSRNLAPNLLSARQVESEINDRRLAGRPPSSPVELEQLRDRLAKTPVRWFTQGSGPLFDQQGRIWVLGTRGDTTFADVFTVTGFVTRLVLPCQRFGGRWSLNGEWMALMCAPDDPDSDFDGVLKLFRIR